MAKCFPGCEFEYPHEAHPCGRRVIVGVTHCSHCGHLDGSTECNCWIPATAALFARDPDFTVRRVPSNAQRAAYFTSHRTSTAAQVSRRPLSSRLIDVAALCFLRGLAMADWVARRLPW